MPKLLISLISLCLLVSCASQNRVSAPQIQKPTQTILAFGDSLTAGYGLPADQSYPAQLESRLRAEWYSYAVQNAWVSGDTSAGLLSRMDWLLEWDAPALAILCIGGNDAFQWKDPAEIEKNIRAIIEKIKAKNIPILFAGMRAPLNLGGEYGKRYEAIFPRLAKEYDLVYIDWLLAWVALKANLNQDDRIHPTREGYAIVVDNLMEILEVEELLRN
jgi:acyl-CoA thioesterase-1